MTSASKLLSDARMTPPASLTMTASSPSIEMAAIAAFEVMTRPLSLLTKRTRSPVIRTAGASVIVALFV